MIYHDAVIHITNLRLRTYIGFNPEELEKKQDVIISAEICYPAKEACQTDDVENVLDYKVLTKAIIQHVETGRFKLLEKLTSDVLEIITAYPRVTAVKVTAEKPHALRFSDSVAITLSAKKA